MLPHEKAIADHQQALEKVYHSVERRNPRGWRWVKKISGIPQQVRFVAVMFFFGGVGIGLGLPFFLIHLELGGALTVIGAMLGMFGGGAIAEVVDDALLKRGELSASPENIKKMSQRLNQYPRLKEVLRQWLLQNGGTIVSCRQEALLSDALDKLEDIDSEESDRLNGLAIVEEEHGLVGMAQATTKSQKLEQVLSSGQEITRPKARM